jgi:hypothetical protein
MYDEFDPGPSEEIAAIASLSHTPVRPPRRTFLREQVYASRWAKLIAAHPRVLMSILTDYVAPVGQREATVAASFVTWLGTNIGQALLETAAKRTPLSPLADWSKELAASDAFLSAWAHENRRQLGINGGKRTLEAILQDDTASQQQRPSADDYEVVEHLVIWLGCTRGQRFLAGCRAEAEAVASIESYASFCRCGVTDTRAARQKAATLKACAAAGDMAERAFADLEAQYGPVKMEPATVAG